MSPVTFTDLEPTRPPCSVSELAAAEAVRDEFVRSGLRPQLQAFRATSSPSWTPLLRALLRVWAGAFLAAGWPVLAITLAGMAAASWFRPVTDLLRHIPLLGGPSQNVVAHIPGRQAGRPLVVAAHLDTHNTGGAPLRRPHHLLSGTLTALVMGSAAISHPGGALPWRAIGFWAVVEGLLTLLWLARREFGSMGFQPDDNTSGLMALRRVAELLGAEPGGRDVWLVATGAGMSGSTGMTAFLRSHPELTDAWVIEIDALGSGEVVACPYNARFPYPGTSRALIEAIRHAASSDPVAVRRVRRPHADARAALSFRIPAITLTAGVPHPADRGLPDAGNAVRAAQIIDALAHAAPAG